MTTMADILRRRTKAKRVHRSGKGRTLVLRESGGYAPETTEMAQRGVRHAIDRAYAANRTLADLRKKETAAESRMIQLFGEESPRSEIAHEIWKRIRQARIAAEGSFDSAMYSKDRLMRGRE